MSDQWNSSPDRWSCASRRLLLAGAGASAIGLTGVLGACGGDGPTAPGRETGAPGPTAPTSAASAGAGTSQALASASDVPVGGGKLAGGVLIVQPSAGTFKAYDAACPHQGVQVTAPTSGVSTCVAHNSTFSIVDGSRITGPATRGLTEIAVRVEGSKIVRA